MIPHHQLKNTISHPQTERIFHAFDEKFYSLMLSSPYRLQDPGYLPRLTIYELAKNETIRGAFSVYFHGDSERPSVETSHRQNFIVKKLRPILFHNEAEHYFVTANSTELQNYNLQKALIIGRMADLIFSHLKFKEHDGEDRKNALHTMVLFVDSWVHLSVEIASHEPTLKEITGKCENILADFFKPPAKIDENLKKELNILMQQLHNHVKKIALLKKNDSKQAQSDLTHSGFTDTYVFADNLVNTPFTKKLNLHSKDGVAQLLDEIRKKLIEKIAHLSISKKKFCITTLASVDKDEGRFYFHRSYIPDFLIALLNSGYSCSSSRNALDPEESPLMKALDEWLIKQEEYFELKLKKYPVLEKLALVLEASYPLHKSGGIKEMISHFLHASHSKFASWIEILIFIANQEPDFLNLITFENCFLLAGVADISLLLIEHNIFDLGSDFKSRIKNIVAQFKEGCIKADLTSKNIGELYSNNLAEISQEFTELFLQPGQAHYFLQQLQELIFYVVQQYLVDKSAIIQIDLEDLANNLSKRVNGTLGLYIGTSFKSQVYLENFIKQAIAPYQQLKNFLMQPVSSTQSDEKTLESLESKASHKKITRILSDTKIFLFHHDEGQNTAKKLGKNNCSSIEESRSTREQRSYTIDGSGQLITPLNTPHNSTIMPDLQPHIISLQRLSKESGVKDASASVHQTGSAIITSHQINITGYQKTGSVVLRGVIDQLNNQQVRETYESLEEQMYTENSRSSPTN